MVTDHMRHYFMHCYGHVEDVAVKHHLLDCTALKDLWKNLKPPNSSITHILYENLEQLKKDLYIPHGEKNENV